MVSGKLSVKAQCIAAHATLSADLPWTGFFWLSALALTLLMLAMPAQAVQFEWGAADDPVNTTINTSIQFGAQWRVEERDEDLVSKTANNPSVCPRAPNGAGTSCQGHTVVQDPLHGPGGLDLNSFVGEGPGANQVFVDAPGQFSNNNDDGNLNYDQGDITQAVGKVSADVTMTWRDYSFFARGFYFYDTENRGRQNFNPAVITQETIDAAGGLRRVNGVPANRDRDQLVFRGRTGAIEEQIETDFKLLDANISGSFPFFGDRDVAVKVGRQPINWGESTILIVNSLNTFNPPDVNALFRPAFLDLAEVLEPIGAISASAALSDSLNLEMFYQYDWEPLTIPAPGAYLSFVDVGSDNARDSVNLGFGKAPEDPDRLGLADQLVLSAVAGDIVTEAFELLPENRASDGGQYGAALRYYADWLNGGTEIAFYAANYHSRLPFVSFYASDYGCFSDPNEMNNTTAGMFNEPTGIGAVDTALLGLACPGADLALGVESATPVPVATTLFPVRNQNVGPDGTAFNVSSMKAQLEYPEDIKLYGVSFNTSFGEISVQGEVAYRPDSPLQVDDTDLAFAALQNAFPRGNGRGDASDLYSVVNNGLIPAPGLPIGIEFAALPGARYAIPDFVSAYRGRDPLGYAPGEYIRGWEYFDTLQYNLGATYITGPENWVWANQIIWFAELGATQVLDLPDTDELQIEAPGTFTHASAGTDGTGADGSRQANSGVIGASGLRFNPTQQDEDSFATDLSWGYRVIAIIRYDNVFPGISFEPTIIWAHDIDGIAPGPGENFIEGRKNLITNIEMRFAQGWSAAIGYVGFYGGGEANLLRDRDFVNLGVRYRF